MKKIAKKFIHLIYKIFNLFILKKNKVKYGNVFINGKLFLKNKGVLILNDGVRINSKYSFNPIGGQSFSTIIVNNGAKLLIDKNTGISNSTIVCWNDIYIGKDVFIGGDCRIYDTDFHPIKFNDRVLNNVNKIKTKPIIIEDGCFIGAGCIILKGVHIGARSVIGAGSVITKSIPSGEVWAGNPAKFIKRISEESL